MPRDWKDIEGDSKEKYQLYLCSREWAERRMPVLMRSGGKCERCLHYDLDHVHHVSYANKYNEPPEDLAGFCRFCHEFTHGKSNWDPLAKYMIRRRAVSEIVNFIMSKIESDFPRVITDEWYDIALKILDAFDAENSAGFKQERIDHGMDQDGPDEIPEA